MRFLMLLVVVLSSSVTFAHADKEGFSRIRSADCAPAVASSNGVMKSLFVSVTGDEATVIAYDGPRNPIDYMKNSYVSGKAKAYSMVGFPNNESEAVIVRLGPDLEKILNRPQIVISAKIFNANFETLSKGFMSNPMTEDEDIDLFCSMAFDGTDEHLEEINPAYVQKAENASVCTIEFRDDKYVKEWTHGCTGTITADTKILTAGHCQEDFADKYTRVRCGSNTEWLSIAKWTKNPDYRPKDHPVDNTRDISVIELVKSAGGPAVKVEYSEKAVQEMILGGAECTHFGMGRRQDGTLGVLFKSEYSFPDEMLGGRNYVERIFEMTNMIASNPLHFMRNGDSGGPIICKNGSGEDVIVGVHSFISLPSSGAFSAMPSRSADFLQSLIGK